MDEHQRSAPCGDFMQHTFQENVLVPIIMGQADCLTFEVEYSKMLARN